MSTQIFTHVYAWKNNPVRAKLYGRRCRIVAQGALGTAMLEFENGDRITSSTRSVRRLSEWKPPKPNQKPATCEYCPGKLKYMPGMLQSIPCEGCGKQHHVCRDCQRAPRVFRGVMPDVKMTLKYCPGLIQEEP